MTKRLVAKVGQYEKDGQTKGEYIRIGVILNNDNGEYALIDPTVSLSGVLMKQRAYAHSQKKPMRDMIIAGVFSDEGGSYRAQNPAQTAHQESKSNGYQPQDGQGFDDDIPF